MGTKINESVWGTVPETGDAIRLAPNSLGTCYNNGTFNPDNINTLDKSVVPWGVPYCGLGGMSYLKKLRSPIPIEGSDAFKAGILSTFDIEEFVGTNNPVILMSVGQSGPEKNNYFSCRMEGAINSSSTAFTSNAASDRGENVPSSSITNAMWRYRPIVYLDYQKVLVQVDCFILWDKNAGTRIVAYNINNYPASGKTWDDYELLGFGYSIYYRTANNTWTPNGYYMAIPVNEKDTSKFVLDKYFGQEIRPQKWVPFTYRNAIKTVFYGDTGSYQIASTAITKEADSEILHPFYSWSGELHSIGNYINGSQTFDNVSYTMEKKCGFMSGGVWFEIPKGSELPGRDGFSQSIQMGVYYKIKDYEPGTSKVAAWAKIIAHEMAFLGLPFRIKIEKNAGTPAATASIADDDVFLPIFDMDHMVTTGRYTTDLTEKQTLPNFTWENIFDSTIPSWDSSYNPPKPGPGPGPGPGPKPNPNPLYPSTPGFSLASAGGKCYALVDGTIDTIFEEIYGRDEDSWLDLINGLSLYGSDPMAAIISYKWYPWAWNFTGTAGLYLGGIKIGNSGYDVPRTDAEALHTENASFYYGREKNFINSRHSQARLWLPFYGFYALP